MTVKMLIPGVQSKSKESIFGIRSRKKYAFFTRFSSGSRHIIWEQNWSAENLLKVTRMRTSEDADYINTTYGNLCISSTFLFIQKPRKGLPPPCDKWFYILESRGWLDNSMKMSAYIIIASNKTILVTVKVGVLHETEQTRPLRK